MPESQTSPSQTSSMDQQIIQQYGLVVHPDLARHFTDFDEEIEEQALKWAGKRIDFSKKPPVVVDFGTPIMNELGISKIIMLLKSIYHKGIPMANFDKNNPYLFARLIGHMVKDEIMINFTKYGLDNISDAEKIILSITINFYAIATRPVSEGERKFIKGYTKESHVIGPQKKGGFSLT